MAPMLHTNFLDKTTVANTIRAHEGRLAAALQIDQARRVLGVRFDSMNRITARAIDWHNNSWARRDHSPVTGSRRDTIRLDHEKPVPNIAFRVLDAPRLKDDYYCTVLAYCVPFRTLAVALTHRVYLWNEESGVRYPPIPLARPFNYVMSIAFSSDEGAKGILAVARSSGQITLWALPDACPRIELYHSCAASCVSFRPSVSWDLPEGDRQPIACEHLLVGDDVGVVHYYSVQWSETHPSRAILLFKVEAHEQNICGLAWSPNGTAFVSGGNDNVAAIFVVADIFKKARINVDDQAMAGSSGHNTHTEVIHMQLRLRDAAASLPTATPGSRGVVTSNVPLSNLEEAHQSQQSFPSRAEGARRLPQDHLPLTPPQSPMNKLQQGSSANAERYCPILKEVHKYAFRHAAAVKAVAFAPWQPALLATGGGSNDKQIHFHHTGSGTTLAVINVFAQVTSLTWSTTKREIAATFGYAQPEHEIRIAVFAWPSCQCTVSIPWERKQNGEISRALWAIPYPGGPNQTVPHKKANVVSRSAEEMASTEEPHRGRRSSQLPPTPQRTPTRPMVRSQQDPHVTGQQSRSEGEPWATRTQEEGSLIIACCDQTVKFFEIWAGQSKGKPPGLGNTAGVLGGSRVLEGWCDSIVIDEVGNGEHVVR